MITLYNSLEQCTNKMDKRPVQFALTLSKIINKLVSNIHLRFSCVLFFLRFNVWFKTAVVFRVDNYLPYKRVDSFCRLSSETSGLEIPPFIQTNLHSFHLRLLHSFTCISFTFISLITSCISSLSFFSLFYLLVSFQFKSSSEK